MHITSCLPCPRVCFLLLSVLGIFLQSLEANSTDEPGDSKKESKPLLTPAGRPMPAPCRVYRQRPTFPRDFTFYVKRYAKGPVSSGGPNLHPQELWLVFFPEYQKKYGPYTVVPIVDQKAHIKDIDMEEVNFLMLFFDRHWSAWFVRSYCRVPVADTIGMGGNTWKILYNTALCGEWTVCNLL